MTSHRLQRYAVRAVVLTPEREVLLMRTRPMTRPPYWLTPGGGVEPGESDEQALRRELREELGLDAFELGPLLMKHTFVSSGARRVTHRQQLFVIEHPRFEPYMSDPYEARTIERFHWWPLDELQQTSEIIFPPMLAQTLCRFLDGALGQADPSRDA
jgi:8-oxo-dGTP pyrophosphatase MutT (NUDIX family)